MNSVSSSCGWYVHIPFCRSRCGYCAFVSELYDADTADAYLEALGHEIALQRRHTPEALPETIYIGGGTPSCLSVKQLEKVLKLLPLSRASEVTCEINPDSADKDILLLLRDYGVTRCSFGIQTFSERGLRLLQRRHSAAAAIKAVEKAADAGFSAISVDIIQGWPGQTLLEMVTDLEYAVSLPICHISTYSLLLEDGAADRETLRAMLGTPEEEDERGRAFWDAGEEFLENRGYGHYETSNYARSGCMCRHNVLIWQGEEYIGFGLGAHSHWGGRRFANTASLAVYLECLRNGKRAEEFSEQLKGKDKARECAVFWLRLFDGIDVDAFAAKTGYAFDDLYADILPGLFEQGIMKAGDGGKRIYIAKAYHPVLDAVLAEML